MWFRNIFLPAIFLPTQPARPFFGLQQRPMISATRRRLPNDRDGVSSHYRVVANQKTPLGQRLSDQQPIKRILVNRRQRIQPQHVFQVNGQNLKAVLLHLIANKLSQRFPKNELAQHAFDLHFPDAGCAQSEFIRGVSTGRVS
jgi:hypothetical protein